MILKTQGKTEEALVAVGEARKAYPNDINLILTHADIYFQLKNMEKYGELMELAISIDPNNPQLFFNLGVISFNEGKIEEARKKRIADIAQKRKILKEKKEAIRKKREQDNKDQDNN